MCSLGCISACPGPACGKASYIAPEVWSSLWTCFCKLHQYKREWLDGSWWLDIFQIQQLLQWLQVHKSYIFWICTFCRFTMIHLFLRFFPFGEHLRSAHYKNQSLVPIRLSNWPWVYMSLWFVSERPADAPRKWLWCLPGTDFRSADFLAFGSLRGKTLRCKTGFTKSNKQERTRIVQEYLDTHTHRSHKLLSSSVSSLLWIIYGPYGHMVWLKQIYLPVEPINFTAFFRLHRKSTVYNTTVFGVELSNTWFSIPY